MNTLKNLSQRDKYIVYFLTGLITLIAIACIVYIPGAAKVQPMTGDEIVSLSSAYSGVNRMAGNLVLSQALNDAKSVYTTDIVLRCVAGLLIWAAIFMIWPTERTAAFSAGLYFVLFPGFLQATKAIEFYPHHVAICVFALSMALMSASFFVKQTSLKSVFIGLSVITGVYYLLVMDSFIGLEIMRVMFIILFCYMYTPGSMKKLFTRAFKIYIPWLVGFVAFLILRATVFKPIVLEEAVEVTTLVGLNSVRPDLLTVLCEIVRNIGKTTYGAWFVTVHQLIDGLDVKAFWPILLRTIYCVLIYYALVQIYWNLGGPVNERHDDPEHPFEYPREPRFLLWQAQWLITATVTMLFVLLPFIMGGHNIVLNSPLDWFAFPCGLAAGMFVSGTMFQLRVRNYEWPMMIVMVGLGSIAQIAAIFAL